MTPSINTKRIVCLANSRKPNGRCIAGREILDDGSIGKWIRPVSDRGGEGVSEYERQYGDGSEPCVLDVIDVPFLSARPKNYQKENWLLDPRRRWVRVKRVERNALTQYTDEEETLWINGYSSTKGRNDRIPLSDANSLSTSLCFIKVNALRVSVSEPYRDTSSNPELRGHFRYNGCDYSLRITDPDIESSAKELRYGDYGVNKRFFLTISLTAKPFGGYLYKLIAAIIKP